MSESYIALIDRIIDLRKERGMTQSELAKAAHLAQPAIARLECKTTVPQLNTLLRVLDALDQRLEVVPK